MVNLKIKNMKHCNLLIFLIGSSILSITSNILYGQVQIRSREFPTYEQIKIHKSEIVDIPKGSIIESKPNLFDYSKNSVIYIMNGKRITNPKYVKDILSKKDIEVENIVVGEPDKKGKRLIIIKYKMN